MSALAQRNEKKRNELTEIRGECQQLLANKHVQSVDRSVPEVFVVVNLVSVFLGYPEVTPGLRDIHLVPFHGRMVAVVTMMGYPPAEVRRPEQSMDDLRRPDEVRPARTIPY